MGHFLRSGSHLYKQATFRKTVVGPTKIGLDFEKMGHTRNKWVMFLKNGSHLRNQ